MPIYEYKCKKCGLTFEALVKVNQNGISCEKCSSQDVKRIFSTFSARSSDGTTIAGNSGCSSCSSSDCSSCSK